MIEVRDVHKRYLTDHGPGPWVLRGINLSLPRGLSVGLIGCNGAGKSTLLRLIGGIDHPLSGYREVEQLLQARGMSSAQPSRREGFTPRDISALLDKAHATPPLHRLGSETPVGQIMPAPVWHGLALDLMLGNLNQALWGWSDPQAIHWLDYWRELDSSLHFILVYDDPHTVLTREHEMWKQITPELLHERCLNWSAYNAALLSFFQRHPQRCLLVHAEQVHASAATYLRQVRARIDAPWSDELEPGRWAGSLTESERPYDAATPGESIALLRNGLDEGDERVMVAGAENQPALDASTLARYVADTLLQSETQCMHLFARIQAVADLPLCPNRQSRTPREQGIHAWNALMVQHQAALDMDQQIERLQEHQHRIEVFAAEQRAMLDMARRQHEIDSHQQAEQLATLEARHDALKAAEAIVRQENEQLMDQLHLVQESMEQHHRSSNELSKKLQVHQERESESRRLAHHAKCLNEEVHQQRVRNQAMEQRLKSLQTAEQVALRRQQQLEQLQQQLAALARHDATQPPPEQAPASESEEDAQALLDHLLRVQEELESYYLENQRLKQALSPPKSTEGTSPPAPTLAPVCDDRPLGAAERVRTSLEYRLYRQGCFFRAVHGAMAYHQEPPGKENETDRAEGKRITMELVREKVPYFYRKPEPIESARLREAPLVSIYIPAYKHIALLQARGEYITCHDADDWSHPVKIERQLRPLLQDDSLKGSLSCWIRVSDTGEFHARQVFPLIRLNPSSLLFRRQPVLQHAGAWDLVRTGADSEFLARIRAVFGEQSVRRIEMPLTVGSHRPGSLMTAVDTGYCDQGKSPARQAYWQSWNHWHEAVRARGSHPWLPAAPMLAAQHRPFPAPEPLWVAPERLSACMAALGMQTACAETARRPGLLATSRALADMQTLAPMLDAAVLRNDRRTRRDPRLAGVLAWGRKPSASRAERWAERLGLPVRWIEDGLLRSFTPGSGCPPLSILVDDVGVHYDATRPSALENLLNGAEELLAGDAAEEVERARALILTNGLSKYNHAPTLLRWQQANSRSLLRPGDRHRILVVDQTVGDLSIACAGAGTNSFHDMLQAARYEHPQATLYIKTHPEVGPGRKSGYLTHLRDSERVRVVREAIAPQSLIREMDHVYVVTSTLGFEALLAGKPVTCFGQPWYAGWGVTDDRMPITRRTRHRTVDELFAAAYLRCARYVDPETHTRGTVFDVIRWLVRQRRMAGLM